MLLLCMCSKLVSLCARERRACCWICCCPHFHLGGHETCESFRDNELRLQPASHPEWNGRQWWVAEQNSKTPPSALAPVRFEPTQMSLSMMNHFFLLMNHKYYRSRKTLSTQHTFFVCHPRQANLSREISLFAVARDLPHLTSPLLLCGSRALISHHRRVMRQSLLLDYF